MGSMAVMTAKDGDLKVEWSADKTEEVEHARETFRKMTADKRYSAFKMKAGGKKGEQIRAFDPKAESIILVPPMQGG